MTKEELKALRNYFAYIAGLEEDFSLRSMGFVLWMMFGMVSTVGLLVCATGLGDIPQHLNSWIISEALVVGYFPAVALLLTGTAKTNKAILRMRGKGPAAIKKKNVDERYIAELEQEVLSD